MESIRLNKYLSDAGICSRRQADRWIEEKRITVNGEIAGMGMKVAPDSEVCLDGKLIKKEEKKVLLAMNKPAGIVCTAEKRERNNIVDYMKYPKRIYPVGRLDKDSTGLLLLTNDGELVNKIMRAGNYHEKEYLVSVNKPVTEEFCRKMSRGVAILDTVTRPCKVEKTGEKSFRIILTQGLNRQIRRMCETLGYRVMTLQRVRIMNIKLGVLKPGTWRNLTDEEMGRLTEMLKGSSSKTVIPEKEDRRKSYGKKRRR